MASTDSSYDVIGIERSVKEGEPLLGREPAKFPRSVFFIISNELCERFSFYGLKAILYIYFLDYMLFSDSDATAVVHGFIMVSYAFTLLGGYVADTLLGKYRTIFYLTFVYILGSSLLALSAVEDITGTPPHWWLAFLALLFIALGTGGIKPCISTFVGDQFGPGQESMLDNVFFLFYFFVNVGSLLSTILTPEIKKISFVYAFGLPAILLTVSLVLFVAGRTRYVKKVPSGNAYAEIGRVISLGWRGARARGLRRPNLDWLDFARDECGQDSVNSVKSLLRVAKVLLPIAVFWSLYDQHSTRWISQAKMMNLEVFGYPLEAAQIPAINPFLIVTSVPLFNKVIYPGLKRCGCNPMPLTRVGIGMVLTAVSFALTALVQTMIDHNPEKSIWIGFQLPQYIVLGFAEVMVSVTGLEFAYQQAPNSMKAVIMAIFYCTVALGNLLVVVIALIEIPGGMAMEFWFFCGLMLLFTIFFSCLARGFPYQLHMAVPETSSELPTVDEKP